MNSICDIRDAHNLTQLLTHIYSLTQVAYKRLVPDVTVVMHDVEIDVYERRGRDDVTVERRVARRHALNDGNDAVQTQRFLDA